jgi:hypothetical protein
MFSKEALQPGRLLIFFFFLQTSSQLLFFSFLQNRNQKVTTPAEAITLSPLLRVSTFYPFRCSKCPFSSVQEPTFSASTLRFFLPFFGSHLLVAGALIIRKQRLR